MRPSLFVKKIKVLKNLRYCYLSAHKNIQTENPLLNFMYIFFQLSHCSLYVFFWRKALILIKKSLFFDVNVVPFSFFSVHSYRNITKSTKIISDEIKRPGMAISSKQTMLEIYGICLLI